MPFANDLLTPRESVMRAAQSCLQRLLHPSPPAESLHFLWSFCHPRGPGRKGGRSLASTEHFRLLWSESLRLGVWHSQLLIGWATSGRSLPCSRPVSSSLVRNTWVDICKISGSKSSVLPLWLHCLYFKSTWFFLVKKVIEFIVKDLKNYESTEWAQSQITFPARHSHCCQGCMGSQFLP